MSSILELCQLPARYQVLRELGAGGFGTVLAARDRELGRSVAIKVLRPSLEPSIRQRFQREAQLLADLEHPNLVRVYDVAMDREYPLIISEMVRGRDLKGAVPADPVAVMLDAARGLDALHQASVLHRDIKPENILLTEEGRAVLIDLGLASGEEMEALTKTGLVVGTPAYLAPELFRGQPASPASDWYAWGATLFFLLEGKPLIDLEAFQAAIRGDPLPGARFRRAAQDSVAARLVVACLDPEPARRPRGLQALERLAQADEVAAVDSLGPRASAASGAGPARLRTAVGPGSKLGTPSPPGGTATQLPAAALSPPDAPSLGLRALPGLLALVAAAAVWTWAPGRAPSPPEPAPPTTSPETPRPLGPDLDARLSAELDAALYLRLDSKGALAPAGHGQPFVEVLSFLGVAALDVLPEQDAVLTWIAGGGDLTALAEDDLEALRRNDRALVDLGAPPTFAPFLHPGPVEPEGISIGGSPFVGELLDFEGDMTDPQGAAWVRAAQGHLRTALRLRAALGPRLDEAHRQVGVQPASLFTEHRERPLEGTALSLRGTPQGRDRLRDLLAEGRAALRAYLVSARNALDFTPATHGATHLHGYRRGFEQVTAFACGALVTARRDRLFGPPAATPLGLAFEARILGLFRVLADRALVDRSRTYKDELAALDGLVEDPAAIGNDELAASVAARWLHEQHKLGGDPDRIREVYMRCLHLWALSGRLLGARVDAAVRDLGLPPYPRRR